MVENIVKLEERTKKVEEAIIRFEYIADVILVQLESRIKSLEKHDEEFSTIIYNSCDVKSKEIDTKIKDSSDGIYKAMTQYFIWGISINTFLFFLFVGYIGYQQGIYTKFSDVDSSNAVKIQENSTHIDIIVHNLDTINTKLDQLIKESR